MYTANINGITVDFPQSWSEVTVSQFLAIRSMPEHSEPYFVLCKALEIFSGIPAKEWFDMPAEAIDNEEVYDLIGFTREKIDFSALKMKDTVTIAGVEHKVPRDLTLQTYGQVTVFESKVIPIAQSTGDFVDAIPTALAIFLQPLITGKKFDADKLSETENMIGEMLLFDAFPVAAFFLRKYVASLRMKNEPSHILQHSKKRKQGSKS